MISEPKFHLRLRSKDSGKRRGTFVANLVDLQAQRLEKGGGGQRLRDRAVGGVLARARRGPRAPESEQQHRLTHL